MTSTDELHALTGAFGYTGWYITRRLLEQGCHVVTLTGRLDGFNPFGDQVRVAPFNFDNPMALTESLQGVGVLYNTYWVRFSHGNTTFEQAVRNSKVLIDAAREAGVRRFVHVSITNPSMESPLPYFRGKAELEKYLQSSGLSYAILRPAVVFGREDILLNNIAYLLRRLPAFAVPGRGNYRLQPIFVDDLASLAVSQGASSENGIIDAIGPETFTFTELVKIIRSRVGSRARLISVPPGAALALSGLLGKLVHDVVLTRDELLGLTQNLLVTDSTPTGRTPFSEWARDNAHLLGAKYASELERHYRSPLHSQA